VPIETYCGKRQTPAHLLVESRREGHEITSALDEETSENVLEKMRARQRATGLATHDLALARRFADPTLDVVGDTAA
jgi:ABC-type methionine transport system ATPase subunit